MEALDPIRFSQLKHMARSPAHYRGAVVNRTSDVQKGTAVHALILGGRRVIAYPGKVRNGKEWESFAAANADAEILTKRDFEKAQAMAAAVRADPEAMRVLDGLHEHRVDWQFLGRACRSTLDVIAPHHITELKASNTSDPARFMWQSLRMHYEAQLAFYDEAVRTAGLCQPKEHYVVVVESSPPFVPTVFKLTERAIEKGRASWRFWFERVLACEAAGSWPGYCEAVVDLDVPEDDVELTFGEGADETTEDAA